MIRCYLPFLDNGPVSDATDGLLEYLTQKVLLKIGAISGDQFLEEMAKGFSGGPQVTPGNRSLPSPSGKRPAPLMFNPKHRRVLVDFLTDLSLNFNRKRTVSIFDFLKPLGHLSHDH